MVRPTEPRRAASRVPWLRPLPRPPLDRALTLAGFAAGASLAMIFLWSIARLAAPFAVAAALTAVYAVAGLDGPGARRVARGLAAAVLAALHLFWLYEALVLGWLLGWTTSPSIRILTALLVAAAAATARTGWQRARVPASLPLGIWIAACLSGWAREEAFVHCDDLARATRQGDVRLVLGTTFALASCRAGEVLPITRYPRRIWESPDRARYVFTTQNGDPAVDPNRDLPGRLPRAVCEIPADGHGEPSCLGHGKAHGLVEAVALGRLFVGAWGARPPDRSTVYELPVVGPITALREAHLPDNCGDFLYEPATDRLDVFCDEGERYFPMRASTLSPLPSVDAPFLPGEVRYDAARHEGVICQAAGPLLPLGGHGYLAIATRGVPELSYRPLGGSSEAPWTWLALSWGCDWDPARREVYAAVPNLGLLATLDYDSGRIVRTAFVGFGLRSVAHDPRRRRVYLSNFLRGEVLAVDAASGAEHARWSAGRFVREVKLARDGDHLLVTSNLGILRIALGPSPPEGR